MDSIYQPNQVNFPSERLRLSTFSCLSFKNSLSSRLDHLTLRKVATLAFWWLRRTLRNGYIVKDHQKSAPDWNYSRTRVKERIVFEVHETMKYLFRLTLMSFNLRLRTSWDSSGDIGLQVCLFASRKIHKNHLILSLLRENPLLI